MNEELRQQRIAYRLSQARESLKEAEALYQASLFRGALNRAYYAMFYSALALSVLKGRVLSKHSGVIAFFDLEFVKPGILPKELSKALHLAFDRRQSSDYGEVWLADQAEAETAITEACMFVEKITQYIDSIEKLSD
jgi:uncharacterized protein (UPF0332 family)